MSEQAILIVINLCGLFLTAAGLIWHASWRLGTLASELQARLSEHRKGIDDDLSALRTEIGKDFVAQQRALGETIAALREKINNVELEAYKVFVRRESFHELIKQTQDATNARFDKIEAKIDRLIEARGHVAAKP